MSALQLLDFRSQHWNFCGWECPVDEAEETFVGVLEIAFVPE